MKTEGWLSLKSEKFAIFQCYLGFPQQKMLQKLAKNVSYFYLRKMSGQPASQPVFSLAAGEVISVLLTYIFTICLPRVSALFLHICLPWNMHCENIFFRLDFQQSLFSFSILQVNGMHEAFFSSIEL